MKKKAELVLVYVTIIAWIIWVALYLIYIRPYVLWYAFDHLHQNRFPIYGHLFLMFGIPFVICLALYYIWKGLRYNIYTGRNTRPTLKKDLAIPRELSVFDCTISEYKGRPIVKGKYINQSIYFLNKPLGSFSVGETENEVLFFPSVHIEKSKSSEIIEPFEEGEFCHYLSEEEAASIKELGSKPLKIQFLQFDKSTNKE